MKLWISLLEAKALPGTECAGDGAYVNGIVLAPLAKDAEAAFAAALWELGWKMVGAEDTEEFSRRCAEFEVDDELKEIACVARRTGAAHFGTFHRWVDTDSIH